MSFKPAFVITLASLIAVSPVHADKLVIITGYWSTGIPAAKAASGFPVTVIVEDVVSKGLVSEDLVRKEVESADTLLLIHTTSNTVLENILNEVISESKKRVFEFDNVLPVPSDVKELNQIKVDWCGLKIPLSMYVQSRSVRNFRSLLSYLLNGHPGPYHLFDGWIEGYDPFKDEIIRPSDPDPEEVADLIRRYGSKTVTLGHTRYPVWFVELLRKHLPRAVAEVMNKMLDIFAEHLSIHYDIFDGCLIQILRLILSHDASKIEKERIPCVLIVVDTTRLESGWTAPIRELCRVLIERGLVPIVLGLHYDILDGCFEDVLSTLEHVISKLKLFKVEAIALLPGFFKMRSPDSPEIKLLKQLNLPVIKLVSLPWTMSEWQTYWRTPSGLDWSALYHIVIPENLGAIEGIPISVREWRKDGPETLLGRVMCIDEPVPEMIHITADRILAWIRLRNIPNREKRVAILYWASEPGKEGVGTASSLDVPASIVNFLAWLVKEGYRVEIPEELKEKLLEYADEIPTDARGLSIKEVLLKIAELEERAEKLAQKGKWKEALDLYYKAYLLVRPLADALGRLMVEEGSNIGSYILRRVSVEGHKLVLRLLAYEHGRFVERDQEIRYLYLLPLDEYLKWYRSLPEEARLCVEKGVFGYLEAVLLQIRKYGPITDPLKLRVIVNGLRSLVSYVAGHLQYLDVPEEAKEQFRRDVESLVDAVIDALTDPKKVGRALELCRSLYAKWSRVEAFYGWFTGWGPPERSRYLVEIDGKMYFVIRGINFGNIIVAPQPARGYYVGISVAYHSTVLPPCHYYLACYYYFTLVFRAHVIVNTGKHGTYEWLPYKPLFMSWWDFPQICIQNVPQVYPYYVADPSEALVAKRRGWAVIVNYLPQSLAKEELTGDMGRLLKLLERYQSSHLSYLKPAILELVKKTRAYELLNLSSLEAFERRFDENCAKLYFLLHDLEEHEVVPIGLHVFGMPPIGEDPVGTMASFAAKVLLNEVMGSLDYSKALNVCREVIERPETRDVDDLHREAARIVELLFESARLERVNFLNALSGGYVPPGFNSSPFKQLDALPTGRNACMFDPRKWPDWISINVAYTVAIPLRTVTRKVVAFDWATDNINTRGLPIAVQMLLLGVLPHRNSDWIVTGVDPSLCMNPSGVFYTRRFGQILVVGRIVQMEPLGLDAIRLVLEPPTGGQHIEVRCPISILPIPLHLGDEVMVLGTLVPTGGHVEVVNARVLSEEDVKGIEDEVLTPTQLLAVGRAFGRLPIRGRVDRVEGRWIILTDGRTEVRVRIDEGRVPKEGEVVTVIGTIMLVGDRPVISASLVLRRVPRRLTDVIVTGTSCFRDVFAHNILTELFLGRVAAILAAEPYLARLLGHSSLIVGDVDEVLEICDPEEHPVHCVRRWLREIVERLSQGEWENPIHETVLHVYLAALWRALTTPDEELARELEEGLKRLYDLIDEFCVEHGYDFESVVNTASSLAVLVPPAENYPFLDWAAVYLALLSCRELSRISTPGTDLPSNGGIITGWIDQIRGVPDEDLPLLAAFNVFCQAPGDYTNVIGKTIESGEFLLEDRLNLAMSWISGLSYVYGPKYWGASFPLLLALNLAAPDRTLHTMVSSDEKATFFYDDCIYAFEGGLRLAVSAVNGLLPKQEKMIDALVLNLRNAALGSYVGGDYSRMARRLAEEIQLMVSVNPNLAPWLRDLSPQLSAGSYLAALLASNMTSLFSTVTNRTLATLTGNEMAAFRYSLLMPFDTYAWYDLMRTVFNPTYVRGLRFHGYSGAMELLKRLGYLIRGWSTLTPGLLGWEGILRRTAATLVENRNWLARYSPEGLFSLAASLLVIAYDRAQHKLINEEVLKSREFVTLVRDVIVPELLRGVLCCCPGICGNPVVQQRFLEALSQYEGVVPNLRVAMAVFATNYMNNPELAAQILRQLTSTFTRFTRGTIPTTATAARTSVVHAVRTSSSRITQSRATGSLAATVSAMIVSALASQAALSGSCRGVVPVSVTGVPLRGTVGAKSAATVEVNVGSSVDKSKPSQGRPARVSVLRRTSARSPVTTSVPRWILVALIVALLAAVVLVGTLWRPRIGTSRGW
ncbi:cobaltochelatase subunit CobN [Methanopyrus sp. KOL6]|uniref:cobaltochelatase subunit CobN n=1 Tax=Methanopyrus sp. KOL6 TaxID=1937004 RepID=UPI000B4B69D8|nr:cobaltochelatase subunit CobN [Methanopyrus sp. KOL6]